jgi:beta-glucuronidase
MRWEAAAGAGTAVISGGIAVSGWEPASSGSGLAAPLPTGLSGVCPRQLYVAGRRAGRTVSALNSTVAGLAGNGSDARLMLTDTGFQTASAAPLVWPEPEGVEFRHDAAFQQSRCAVRSIRAGPQQRGAVVLMEQPCWRLGRAVGMMAVSQSARYPGAVVNIGLGLKAGEFWCSSRTRRLIYHPRTASERAALLSGAAGAEAPAAANLIEATGLGGLTLSGLGFIHAGWDAVANEDGYLERYGGVRVLSCNSTVAQLDPQNCATAVGATCALGACGASAVGGCKLQMAPAAVAFRKSRGVLLDNCSFSQLGAWAVALKEGTQESAVRGCSFTDLSGGAVYVGDVNETRWSLPARLRPVNITVADSVVREVGVEFQGSSGIHVFAGVNTSVEHNQLRNVGYA